MAFAVIAEASLSYLGLGASRPTATSREPKSKLMTKRPPVTSLHQTSDRSDVDSTS